MRCAQGIVLIAACIGAVSASFTRAAQPDTLADSLRDLNSEDYATREAAQHRLSAMPKESLVAMRAAERAATNKEVVVRLREAIKDVEIREILHPPNLSIDLKNATLADIAKALNEQMGDAYLEAGNVADHFTVQAHDLPLWEILRQMDQQHHLGFEYKNPNRQDLAGPATPIIISSLGPDKEPASQGVFTGQGMGILPAVYTDPATGNKVLRCTVCLDPRVRVVHHAMEMQVKKALDQDGHLLTQLVPATVLTASPGRASSTFACTASFAETRELQRIRELSATVKVELLEKEEAARFDLAKLPAEPKVTSRGGYTVEDGGDIYWVQNLNPTSASMQSRIDPGGAGLLTESEDGIDIMFTRSFDEKGKVLQGNFGSTGAQGERILKLYNNVQRATSLEVTVVGKSRKVMLPIVLKDVDLSAIVVAPPRVR